MQLFDNSVGENSCKVCFQYVLYLWDNHFKILIERKEKV